MFCYYDSEINYKVEHPFLCLLLAYRRDMLVLWCCRQRGSSDDDVGSTVFWPG